MTPFLLECDKTNNLQKYQHTERFTTAMSSPRPSRSFFQAPLRFSL